MPIFWRPHRGPICGRDYYFTNKYTLSGSSYNFCALDSVEGQLSDIYATNTFTYEQDGGEKIQDYAWNGALEDSTSNTAQAGSSTKALVYSSVAAGTTTVGGRHADQCLSDDSRYERLHGDLDSQWPRHR